jgi:hypothetical protein
MPGGGGAEAASLLVLSLRHPAVRCLRDARTGSRPAPRERRGWQLAATQSGLLGARRQPRCPSAW